MSDFRLVMGQLNVPIFLMQMQQQGLYQQQQRQQQQRQQQQQRDDDERRAREEADEKAKALNERRKLDFLKLGMALHHQILPLIDGQAEEFSSTVTEFGDKEGDTIVLGPDGKKVLHRFHSNLSKTDDTVEAKTMLLDPTLENPITFSSRIFPDKQTPLIQSSIDLDEAHISHIRTFIDTEQDHLHTDIADAAGEKKTAFDSQLMRRNLPDGMDIVESSFRATS